MTGSGRLHAEATAYSSVVGASIMMTNDFGKCVAILGLQNMGGGGKEEAERLAKQIVEQINGKK